MGGWEINNGQRDLRVQFIPYRYISTLQNRIIGHPYVNTKYEIRNTDIWQSTDEFYRHFYSNRFISYQFSLSISLLLLHLTQNLRLLFVHFQHAVLIFYLSPSLNALIAVSLSSLSLLLIPYSHFIPLCHLPFYQSLPYYRIYTHVRTVSLTGRY